MPKKLQPLQKKTPEPEDSQDLPDECDGGADDFMTFFASEDLPEPLHNQFIDYIASYEQAEWATTFDLLVQGGLALPSPEELDDSQLSAKLWEVIYGLAMLKTFLYSTDHLSDRELYTLLWYGLLREEQPILPASHDTACHIDLVSSGSEEDTELYLRYYADEQTRQEWASDFPDENMPAATALPFDRDRHLPSREQWRCSGLPS